MELEKSGILHTPYVSNTFENELVKDSVESIINLSDEDIIKNYFISLGYEDFLDFYFLKLDSFREVFLLDNNFKELYVNITGEQITKITIKGKLKFIDYLGFKKINYDNLKEILLNEYSNIGINNCNDLKVISLNKFISLFNDNKYFKYFTERVFGKSITCINYDEYILMSKKIGLKTLTSAEQISVMRDVLKKKYNVNYLEDLEKITIREFRKICGLEGIILDYFKNTLGIEKTSISKEDISKFGEKLELKNNVFDKSEYINTFLRTNKITSYDSLLCFGVNSVRDLLWGDIITRGLLEGFGVKYSKEFRLEHIKKFSKFVGLSGIPDDVDKDKEKAKQFILNILEHENITCLYGIKLNGLKSFKRFFRLKKLGPKVFDTINFYIINNVGRSLSKLEYKDLETIGGLIGLEYKTKEIHKEDLLVFLKKNGTCIEELNISKLKRNKLFRTNTSIKYFLNEIGSANALNNLKAIDIEKLIEYVGKI